MQATELQTVRSFGDIGVQASVFLADTKQHLEVDDHGLISIPPDAEVTEVTGFKLSFLVQKEDRLFFAEKEIQYDTDKYHGAAKSNHGKDGTVRWVTRQPIQIGRSKNGDKVWTLWGDKDPNRIDAWRMSPTGEISLDHIGVITHNDGATWRLHRARRWAGQLYRFGDQLMAQPNDWQWGSFEKRKFIFEYPRFKALLKSATLPEWKGTPEDLDPPLDDVPNSESGIVLWYTQFAGMKGQGLVQLYNGNTIWVHGDDIQNSVDEDGVRILHRNDIVEFRGTGRFGNKDGEKLLNVRKVS